MTLALIEVHEAGSKQDMLSWLLQTEIFSSRDINFFVYSILQFPSNGVIWWCMYIYLVYLCQRCEGSMLFYGNGWTCSKQPL